MKTPYGEYNVGDEYTSADGSGYVVVITDVDTYKDVEDICIRYAGTETQRRIDWFKFSYKYKKAGT